MKHDEDLLLVAGLQDPLFSQTLKFDDACQEMVRSFTVVPIIGLLVGVNKNTIRVYDSLRAKNLPFDVKE